jgi:hypothetical protein
MRVIPVKFGTRGAEGKCRSFSHEGEKSFGEARLRVAKKARVALAIAAVLALGVPAVSIATTGHRDLGGIYMTEIVKSHMLCVGAARFARNCAVWPSR